MQIIYQLLIFGIPATLAATAHMFVVKGNLFPSLTKPLDFKRHFRGTRVFGDHKTFRGLLLMPLLAIPSTYLLYVLTERFTVMAQYNIINFVDYHWALIGLIFGLAYILAELPNSFAKRQQKIPEGQRGNWLNVAFDQTDSAIGCMLAMLPFADITFRFFFAGILFYLLLHMAINFLLFLTGVRKNPL